MKRILLTLGVVSMVVCLGVGCEQSSKPPELSPAEIQKYDKMKADEEARLKALGNRAPEDVEDAADAAAE